MYGQGNYATQFRHGSPAPITFQAPPPTVPQPPFQQAPLTATPPPPVQQGPPHQTAHQLPQVVPPPPPTAYHHGPASSQPARYPPPGMVNMSQTYVPLNPPSSSNYGNAPIANSYAQTQVGAPYAPPMGNQGVHHIPPPPALAPPRGLPPSGGQLLYRPPHPPPPGIQHVPTPPPPPPSSFVTVTPAPFVRFVHGSVNEAHPPSLPPPPPPPPPSSPPPVPSPPPLPSSHMEELTIMESKDMTDFKMTHDPDDIPSGSGDATQLMGDVLDHGSHLDGSEKVDSSASKEEPLPLFSPPPPRPADDVVCNIEALCKFMANVGPQFESMACVKEAGNPQFSFLFGGESGSAAAVGYEYFQWMKRRCQLEVEPCNRFEKILLSPTASNPHSYMVERRPSPAESDMDMDDDASQPERSQGISELNKENNDDAVSKEEQFHAPLNVTTEGLPVMSVQRLLPSSESSFVNPMECDGDKFTEHHISAASPEATASTVVCNLQQSVRPASENVPMIDIPSPCPDSKNGEVARVLVKDGSPFRLIQGYASDDSVEDDKKKLVVHASSDRVGFDMSHDNERAEISSSFDLIDAAVTKNSGQLHCESAESPPQDMPTGVHTVGSSLVSHIVASPKTVSPSPLHGVNETNEFASCHQDGPALDGVKGVAGASSHSDIAVAEKDNFSPHGQEFCPEKHATKDSILKVDEFGRMIREGASSSDSEEMHYERHGRSGRSPSINRSPQQNRRRSRSPWRWRERRSPPQSWSPRRQHSKSKSPPPPRRMGERARRNHAQPPECFNFVRGRCIRGTSCRFLHHDSGRYRTRPQEHRDISEDSEKHVHSNFKSSEQSLTAKNTVEETPPVRQESFLLDGKSQELLARTDLLSDSMKDEDLGRGCSLDSVKEDAENLISCEVGQSQDTGEVDEELGSHEVLDSLQGSHDAEQLQEVPGTSLSENDNAQKPPDECHTPADDGLDNQVSPIPEKQHPLGEGLGRPSSSEVPTNETQPSNSVVTPQSEPQSISLSQHLDAGPSVSPPSPAQRVRPSDFQVPMPAAQPYTGEIPLIQVYLKPSPVSLSYTNQVPGPRLLTPQPSSFAGGSLSTNLSQTQPLAFQGHPHFPSFAQTQPQPSQGHPPNYPLYASQLPRENFLQTSGTSFLPQPSPVDRFPPNQPSLTGDYHSVNAPPVSRTWVDLPPPSYGKEPSMHPIPNMNSHSQFQPSSISLRGEFPLLQQRQVLHSFEEKKPMDDFMQRPLPAGTHHGQVFGAPNLIREEQQYLQHPVTEGHQFPSSIHPLPLKRGVLPVPGYTIQSQAHRPFLREDFHVSAARMPYSQQASHGLQPPPSGNFPPNVAETVGTGPLRYPLSISDDNLSSHLSEVGLSKITVPTHYNPFASTFEQPAASSKYAATVLRQEGSTSFDRKYDSSFGYGHRLMGGHGSTKITTSPLSAGPDAAFLAKPGGPLSTAQSQELMDHSYPWQKSVEEIVQKQFRKELPLGDQYDPLFDSIEPSLKMSKKPSSIQEQDPVVHDTDIARSVHVPADVEENNKQKLGQANAAKIDNDEFGETAPDAEVGAVENESPVLEDGRDWSPAIPIDLPDTVTGDVEIDQIRTPGKSKKNKDSRSMKLFKIALADFVKEVLKPSWRQGNMSKEAFKTIVKKTVDKVSGSVSKHHIPKTQAKINQYVESSQRKLTKLVMGYVDKYVKM